MSLSKTYSAQPHYLIGQIVSVEVDITSGIKSLAIIGMASRSVDEAKDRIVLSLKNSGFKSIKKRKEKVVLALGPAEVKKDGAYHDMAMALAYLVAIDEITFDCNDKLFIGELSLDGSVHSIHGILPLVQSALIGKFKEVYVPYDNLEEALLVQDLDIYPVKNLSELIEHLNTRNSNRKKIEKGIQKAVKNQIENSFNFNKIHGQEQAKRGLEIAATGKHNIVLYGPPGTGKTMLARALNSVLPALNDKQTLEVTGIHSIAGVLDKKVITKCPFRNPHHTSSYVALLGGGASIRPGEVTLAHLGVLFLDEFPEFDKRVIESLRQPLEDGFINIVRAAGSVHFPAEILLIAAMNPCPCGFYGSLHKQCTCGAHEIEKYRKKLSGPITDRIDMWISVEHIEYRKLTSNEVLESSEVVAKRVQQGREFGTNRSKKIELTDNVKSILEKSAKQLKLSPRSFYKIIDLARTIADLDMSIEIKEEHLYEALQFRPKIYT